MTQAVPSELCLLIAGVLEVAPAEIDDATGPATNGQWTSLRHLQIITVAQQRWSVVLTPRQIRSVRSVSDLHAALCAGGAKL